MKKTAEKILKECWLELKETHDLRVASWKEVKKFGPHLLKAQLKAMKLYAKQEVQAAKNSANTLPKETKVFNSISQL